MGRFANKYGYFHHFFSGLSNCRFISQQLRVFNFSHNTRLSLLASLMSDIYRFTRYPISLILLKKKFNPTALLSPFQLV